MKIGVVADLHFHDFNEFGYTTLAPGIGLPINSRLLDQLVTFINICKDAKQRGVTHLIVNGDVFHIRGTVPVGVYQFVYMYLQTITIQLGIKVAILTGNHDQVDKAGAIHSVYGLRDIVCVVDRPGPLKIGAFTIWCIPYITDKDKLKEELDKAPEADILFAHLGVDGAEVGPIEYKIKSPVTVEDLHPERYKQVFLGHYHKPQKLASNVYYVGSPWQLNRGEAADIKRWFLYDTDLPDVVESIPTLAHEFKTIPADKFLAKTSLVHYYDVVMAENTDVQAVMDKAKIHHVHIIPYKPETEHKARVIAADTMSDEELLDAYINSVKGEPNQKLLDLGMQLLSKAVSTFQNNTRLSFLRVVINNFMVIKHVDLVLHRPGSVIALQGDNQGVEGYTSNGAGKSSLLPESIFWCLWGDTARGLPADKVVNRKIKRDCSVQTLLLAGNRKLDVTRYRKHKQLGGDGIRLFIDGQDFTKGTPKLTQECLDRELGVDFVTFSSVMAFSPDTLRFVSSTDANQKHVLDSILQTRRFTAALGVAKQAITVLKEKGLTLSQETTDARNTVESLQETATEYQQLNATWEAREQGRVDTLVEQICEEQKKLETADEGVIALSTKISETEEWLANVKDALPDMMAINAKFVEAASNLGSAQTTRDLRHEQLLHIEASLTEAVDLAGKPCPTCGQKVANTGKLIANYQSERNRLQRSYDEAVASLTQIQELRKQLNTERNDAQKAYTEFEAEQESLERRERSLTALVAQVVQYTSRVATLQEQIEAVPVNEYETLINTNAEKLSAANTLLETASIALRRNGIMMDRLTFWVTGFGGSGVRSLLLDHMLPALTKHANKFADRLAGGSIQIGFQTHQEDTTQDKFTIQAWNAEGSDIYKGNSSGEKRRVDVCVMLALFLVAYSRTRVNILLLDEALDTLDVAGLEGIVSVLEDMAKELNITIYVTSHTDLNNRLHECIVIKKTDGVSFLQK